MNSNVSLQNLKLKDALKDELLGTFKSFRFILFRIGFEVRHSIKLLEEAA